MLIAAECERHAGLHINADHLVVELVDSRGHQVTEEAGDVVITDLHNLAMPFVRYRNGDRATAIRDGDCACGRRLPLLQSVEGRILDMIVTPDGRHVPGEFFVYVMLGRTAISRYQVVQVAIDALEVRIMSERHFQITNASRSPKICGGHRVLPCASQSCAVDAIEEPAQENAE